MNEGVCECALSGVWHCPCLFIFITNEIWMIELSRTFYVPPVPQEPQAYRKRWNWPKVCPPNTCTHISLHCWNFDVEKGCWAVKRLSHRQAVLSRTSKKALRIYINVKQIKNMIVQTRPLHHIPLLNQDNKHLCFAIQCLGGWIMIHTVL